MMFRPYENCLIAAASYRNRQVRQDAIALQIADVSMNVTVLGVISGLASAIH